MIATIALSTLLALPQGECKVSGNASHFTVRQGSQAVSLTAIGSLESKSTHVSDGVDVLTLKGNGAEWIYDVQSKRVIRAVYQGRSLASGKPELLDCNFKY